MGPPADMQRQRHRQHQNSLLGYIRKRPLVHWNQKSLRYKSNTLAAPANATYNTACMGRTDSSPAAGGATSQDEMVKRSSAGRIRPIPCMMAAMKTSAVEWWPWGSTEAPA